MGYELLTTALVTELADCSIGTLYRYFPSRVGVLQALAGRNIDRFEAKYINSSGPGTRDSLRETVDSMLDGYSTLFATEKGFRSLRFGDPLDLPRTSSGPSGNAVVADKICVRIAAEGSGPGEAASADIERANQKSAVTVVLTIYEAMLVRAFSVDANGDPELIAQSRAVVNGYLDGVFAAERETTGSTAL